VIWDFTTAIHIRIHHHPSNYFWVSASGPLSAKFSPPLAQTSSYRHWCCPATLKARTARNCTGFLRSLAVDLLFFCTTAAQIRCLCYAGVAIKGTFVILQVKAVAVPSPCRRLRESPDWRRRTFLDKTFRSQTRGRLVLLLLAVCILKVYSLGGCLQCPFRVK